MSYTFIDGIPHAGASQIRRVRHYEQWGKRLFDVILVVLILPIAVPVILIAWATTVMGGSKGFYGQQRIGQGGRIFQCWKVRTMRPDADYVLAKLVADCPDIAREWQINQKLQCDPRITPVGRFLRRTSIDELPQLWNVLTGEMSLIGPRPFTPDQKLLYDKTQPNCAYYWLRPGISGLWQVQSRNEGVFQDRVSFDDIYAKNMSLWFDLKIALLTLFVILRTTGK
ncbi:MAG: sugar transferase [Paracoccaceae bacterium]